MITLIKRDSQVHSVFLNILVLVMRQHQGQYVILYMCNLYTNEIKGYKMDLAPFSQLRSDISGRCLNPHSSLLITVGYPLVCLAESNWTLTVVFFSNAFIMPILRNQLLCPLGRCQGIVFKLTIQQLTLVYYNMNLNKINNNENI